MTAKDNGSLILFKSNGALSTNDFKRQGNAIKDLLKSVMKVNKDYGQIPGTQNMSLLKPGAEKLAKMFGLTLETDVVKEVEDWENGFFYYRCRATLKRFGTGEFVGSIDRSCNSKEKKYLYISEWVGGQKQKRKRTAEEAYDISNTILGMAEKRAAVAVVYQVTGASDIFEPEQEVNEEGMIQEVVDDTRPVLMAKLFAAGTERGFSADQVKKAIYKMFGVDSVTKASQEQIEEFIEKLYTTYSIVNTGNAPKKIVATPETNTPEVVEGEVVNEAKEQEKEEIFTGVTKCYQCEIEFDKSAQRDTSSDYFCSKKCQDEYNAKADRLKASAKKDFDLINKKKG